MSSRLELLRRKNAGRKLREEWEKVLFCDIGLPSDQCRLVDLEDSCDVILQSKSKFMPREDLKNTKDEQIRKFMERLLPIEEIASAALVIGAEGRVFVIFLDSDKVGVLELPAPLFNEHWQDLINFQPDGFSVVDSAFRHKLVIQVLSAERGDLVDIAAWGPEWVEAVSSLRSSEEKS
jgi:hypothetical protein